MKKRGLSILLALCMVLALLPALGTQANAATGGHTRAEAVAWAQSQNGASLDYDGVYGAQCVDLIKYYYAYLGDNAGYARGNANEYASNALPSGWTRVYGDYQPGDIAVFKVNHSSYNENGSLVVSTGSLGHVSIITSVSGSWFYSMNQNFNNHSYVESKNFPVDAIQCAIRPDFGDRFHYYVDQISGGVNSIYLWGWLYNEDNITKSIQLHAYIDGGPGTTQGYNIPANAERNDVAAAYSCGAYHGFEYTITGVSAGTHVVQLFANDQYRSTATKIGDFTVTVEADTIAPQYHSVTVTDITTTSYTVTVNVTDNVAIDTVKFPTWNGYTQTGADAVWSVGERSGDNWSFTVQRNAEESEYTTDIYAYDKAGNSAKERIRVQNLNVSFDANGGNCSQDSVLMAALKTGTGDAPTYGQLPVPTREGYRFDGWYTYANGGVRITGSTEVTTNVDVLYAHWSKVIPAVGGNLYIALNNAANGTYAVVTGCDGSVTNVVVPSSVDGIPVREVNTGAFQYMSRLRTIVLPSGLQQIGRFAFLGCNDLKAVYIPGTVDRIVSDTADYSQLHMQVYFGGSEGQWNYIWSEHGTTSAKPFNGTGRYITVHFNSMNPANFYIMQHPQDVTAEMDKTVHFSAFANGTEVSYQWQYLPVGASEWVNLGSSGSDANTLTISAAARRNGQRFRCVVTDVYEAQRISDPATLTVTVPDPVNPFVDVAKGKFYYDPVLWAISQNPQITTGVTDTTFEPDRTCTRAHVVTFLWRANGCPEPQSLTSNFKDVKETNKYYYKAVLWAAEQGITTGYADGTFRPDDECTRGQVVTFLWRAKGQPTPTSAANPFSDVPAGKYYTNAVLWALENNITQGRTSTSFGPDDACTRGHVVTFLYRAYA